MQSDKYQITFDMQIQCFMNTNQVIKNAPNMIKIKNNNYSKV